ncbi:MAG: flagellar assembly protein FliX [Alphaproteobacteria bacterium]|nr:flagellar assembly protein FliX [Alphaproteobacteria bacterium]
MKITQTGPVNSATSRRVGRHKKHSQEAFSDHMVPEQATDARAVTGIKGAAQVDSVLLVQEVDNPEDRPTKARQRAEDILDQLDKVRHGLLAGAFSRRELEGLARLVRIERLEVDDPRLGEILDQIELRAAIELAKYSTLD